MKLSLSAMMASFSGEAISCGEATANMVSISKDFLI
jgi:hypothetical protein